MMKTIFKPLVILVILTATVSCKKDTKSEPDPEPTPTETGNVSVLFEHVVDGKSLLFDSSYVNANGDTFKVSKFNYFISNVVFVKEDGSTFAEAESFHLIKHSSPATNEFTVSNVPVGAYKAIKFTIGVDSARNVSGVQSGDLSPSKSSDMFWGWSTGYIFFKLEGKAPRSGDVSSKVIEYHVGGYGGVNKGQRNVSLEFDSYRANVSTTVKPKVHLMVNVNKVFNGQTKIDFSKPNYYNVVMVNAYSKEIADNYATMFSFDHVHND